MYKLITYIFVFILLFRLINSVFKYFLGTSPSSRQPRNKATYDRGSREGNINIDFMPKKEKKSKDFKGGQYVDYEEVE